MENFIFKSLLTFLIYLERFYCYLWKLKSWVIQVGEITEEYIDYYYLYSLIQKSIDLFWLLLS